jgi:hypothetical protein
MYGIPFDNRAGTGIRAVLERSVQLVQEREEIPASQI